jgi:hypothetical protein
MVMGMINQATARPHQFAIASITSIVRRNPKLMSAWFCGRGAAIAK